MRIKQYEKRATTTLHVSGVDAELDEWLTGHCERTGAPKAFFVNQALTELKRSAEAKPKPAKKSKAAAA